MFRSLLIVCFLPLAVAGLFVAAATAGGGWVIAAGVTLALAACASFLFRYSAGFNPVYTVATLAAGFVLGVGFVRALSVFPPFPVLGVGVVVAAAAVVATLFGGRRVRERRALAGLCADCGYDLRESDGRCPECGAAIPEELARRRRIAAELNANRDAVRERALSVESTGE